MKDDRLANFFSAVGPIKQEVAIDNPAFLKLRAVEIDTLHIVKIKPAVIGHVVHSQIDIFSTVGSFFTGSVADVDSKTSHCRHRPAGIPEHLCKPGFDEDAKKLESLFRTSDLSVNASKL